METKTQSRAELILIRHAPVISPGHLFGRTDVGARIDADAIARVQERTTDVKRVVCSPAKRCRQTAEAVFSTDDIPSDARLWEQDFGSCDGLPFEDLPDLGVLDNAALAAHAYPDGESFADLCARVAPALDAYANQAFEGGPIALVVHAGVIRAALARLIGHVPAGLTFEVANLSVTRLRAGPKGPVSVIEANRT